MTPAIFDKLKVLAETAKYDYFCAHKFRANSYNSRQKHNQKNCTFAHFTKHI